MRSGRTAGLGGFAVVALTIMAVTGCTPSDAPSEAVPPSASQRSPTASPGSSSASPSPAESTLQGWWQPAGSPETLASGLDAPWSVAPLPEGGALISQRDDGRVRELGSTGQLRDVGVVPGVVPGGEAGLHGLALREDAGERWLYAYHGAAEDNRVVRMRLTGDAGGFGLEAAEVVFDGIARAGNHNGGRIAFGPDGMLYVATGDAGRPGASQDPASPNGKILRLTPEGEPAPGNPFDSAVWSLGHRNVQGLAWTSDGTMWASEFGQNTWDELNAIVPGANYGWPEAEGIDDGDDDFVDPVAQWRTDEASPSGIAAVGDTVFMTGLRGERLWIIHTEGGAVAADPTPSLEGAQGRLRDAVAAPDGSLWLLTSNTDGRGSPRAEDDVLLRLPLAPG